MYLDYGYMKTIIRHILIYNCFQDITRFHWQSR